MAGRRSVLFPNLTSLQHGFRKGHSCVTQLIQVVNDWMDGIDYNSDEIAAAT